MSVGDQQPPLPSVSDEWRSGSWTWSWLSPLIKLGSKRTLAESDIGANHPRDRVQTHLAEFEGGLAGAAAAGTGGYTQAAERREHYNVRERHAREASHTL